MSHSLPGAAPVAVIGGGSWGIALAQHLLAKGVATLIWSRDPARTRARDIWSTDRPKPEVVADPEQLADAATLVLAVPAQQVRAVIRRLLSHIRPDAVLVNTAKGIEVSTGMLLSEVIAEVAGPRSQATLSGPSFASDVREGVPVAVAVACRDAAVVGRISATFSTDSFRVDATDDFAGVQFAGAYKNLIAIACGLAAGAGLGDSARAAVLTGGFAELVRLGRVVGGRSKTFTGVAGLGDVALSCSGPRSRNFAFGVRLATSATEKIDSAELAEGAATAMAVPMLVRRYGENAPFCGIVEEAVRGQLPVRDALTRLLETVPGSHPDQA